MAKKTKVSSSKLAASKKEQPSTPKKPPDLAALFSCLGDSTQAVGVYSHSAAKWKESTFKKIEKGRFFCLGEPTDQVNPLFWKLEDIKGDPGNTRVWYDDTEKPRLPKEKPIREKYVTATRPSTQVALPRAQEPNPTERRKRSNSKPAIKENFVGETSILADVAKFKDNIDKRKTARLP